MANNRVQVKRTSTTGRTPNTTGSYATNSQYISAGELALNMTDGILYSSDGTNLITVGSNLVNQRITNSLNLDQNKPITFKTVNTAASVSFIQQNDDNFVFYTTNASYGQRAVWSIFANNNTANLKFAVQTSFNGNVDLNIVAVYANGSPGTAGQVLTTNGQSTYWSTVSGGGSVNTAAQYSWTNTHTFSANVSFTGNGIGITSNTGAIYLGGIADANWKIGRNTGVLTKWRYTNNSIDIVTANSNLEGFAIGLVSNATYFETGYLGTYIAANVTIGNSASNSTINSTAFSGTSNNATFINGNNVLTVMESLRANRALHGGGTITVSASGDILWSARFIVISNGRGTHFGTEGFFNISCPTSGTITGVGGAANKTATAAGIPLAAWEALYYILPIGSNSGSLAANFRVVSYTSDVEIPSNWLLICAQNDDNKNYYFNNGIILKVSQSFAGGTFTSANMPQANNANNLGGTAAASYQLNSTLNANIASYLPTYTGVVNGSSHTVGSSFIANATGVYHTGTVNAASHTVGTAFTANATLTNTVSLVVSTNTSTFGTAMYVIASGNVGIGVATPAYTLEVNGAFAATTKSFVINHPSKKGMKLRHGSLEGPENGVYVRGRTNTNIIELPDYWVKLIDKDSITVSLTAIGKTVCPSVGKITNKKINLMGDNIDCFFHVFAERKDVEKLVVEY